MLMDRKFNQACVSLSDMDSENLSSLDFENLCQQCKADPKQMNNMFYATFGMSADELIDQYLHCR